MCKLYTLKTAFLRRAESRREVHSSTWKLGAPLVAGFNGDKTGIIDD